MLGLPLCAGYELLERYSQAAKTAPASPERPEKFGRDVICLQMEDHYGRAHTAQGSASHLMTPSDAAARMARPELQVD